MKTKSRLISWLTIIFLLPVAIFIYERSYNRDAMIWIICTTVLATAYETWHYFNTKKK